MGIGEKEVARQEKAGAALEESRIKIHGTLKTSALSLPSLPGR